MFRKSLKKTYLHTEEVVIPPGWDSSLTSVGLHFHPGGIGVPLRWDNRWKYKPTQYEQVFKANASCILSYYIL